MRQRDKARCPWAKTELYVQYHDAEWGAGPRRPTAVRRDFKFVGSTICFAFMQAVGMVNYHPIDCFGNGELRTSGRSRR